MAQVGSGSSRRMVHRPLWPCGSTPRSTGILGQPEVREQLLSRGADLMPMSVDDFSRFVRAEQKNMPT